MLKLNSWVVEDRFIICLIAVIKVRNIVAISHETAIYSAV
jgi:hypothetical protein